MASFPRAYPDELFYSICARYSGQARYPNKESVLSDLFGTTRATAIIYLPCHLEHLIQVLPPGHNYTIERLINEHTLLPFFSPFLPTERVQRLRSDMQGDHGVNIYGYLGVHVGNIKFPQWFRFCPLCASEDESELGEPYWHRLHQVPGVEVCPIHEVFLENSHVPIRHRRNAREFISAQVGIHPLQPRLLNLSNSVHQSLLKIAQDAAWLLAQKDLIKEPIALRHTYLCQLAKFGLTTYKAGNTNHNKLIAAFKKHYPNEVLVTLSCTINEQSQSNWLFDLVRPGSRFHHPLHHLLMSNFLGYTIAEFFQLKEEYLPFGEAPWPCLNPVCPYFQQPQITQYQCLDWGTFLTGIFTCSCGFAYSRVGPEREPSERFRLGKIQSYGSVWEIALQRLWSDETVTLKQISHRLGVCRVTVKRQAVKLGLTFPRPGGKTAHIPVLPPRSGSTKINITTEIIESYRSTWLQAMQSHPQTGRTALRIEFGQIYTWLYKHDVEWLKAHLPPRTYNPQGVEKDWKSRDVEYAQAVRLSAKRFRDAPGRPVRISKFAIGNDIGQPAIILKSLHKLPLTAIALASVVESYEDIAIRRLWWVVDCYRRKKYCPTRSQLVSRAHLSQAHLVAAPAVLEAIEAALSILSSLVASSPSHTSDS